MKIPTKMMVTLSALALALALSGCYMVPLDSEGRPIYPPYQGSRSDQKPAEYSAGTARVISLPARLYPANDIAAGTGVVAGVVTNLMTGKGRFNLDYRDETLTGEATQIAGDQRRGVASAFGRNGAFMSCEYQMNSARQGAGTCTFSDGAKYKLHIGS